MTMTYSNMWNWSSHQLCIFLNMKMYEAIIAYTEILNIGFNKKQIGSPYK